MDIEYIIESITPRTLTSINIKNITSKDIINKEITINIPSIINDVEILNIGKRGICFVQMNDDIKKEIISKISCINFIIEEGPQLIINFEILDKLPINISVEIPSSIKIIDNHSFSHINFKNFSIKGNNIHIIQPETFSNCCFFEKFILPKSCEIISEKAFVNTTFHKGIEFPTDSKLFKIEKSAFVNANINNSKLIFPKNLTIIGPKAFYKCKKLKEIFFSTNSQIKEISSCAFDSSSIIKAKIQSIDNMLTIGISCFYKCENLSILDLENTKLTYITDNLCSYCSNLVEVKFPSTLLAIGEFAFQGCALSSITLPKSIANLNNNCFCNNKIKEIKFEDDINNIKRIGFSAFNRNELETLPKNFFRNIEHCGEGAFTKNKFKELTIEAPYSIAALSASIFAFNYNLKTINLINTEDTKWTHIAKSMFDECNSLETVNLPNTIICLENSCFFNTNIKNIEIKNIKLIASSAFKKCKKLETCDFSESKSIKIEEDAFCDCTSLKEIKFSKFLSELNISKFKGLAPKYVDNIVKYAPFVNII